MLAPLFHRHEDVGAAVKKHHVVTKRLRAGAQKRREISLGDRRVIGQALCFNEDIFSGMGQHVLLGAIEVRRTKLVRRKR